MVQVAVTVGLVASLSGCFGNGVHGVGRNQVAPGLYTSSIALGGLCIIEHGQSGVDSSFGGNFEVGGRSFIQLISSDNVVASSGCGIWVTPRKASYNPNRATAQFGTYRVPTDLLPGTYSAPGSAGCRWERLSSFKGDSHSIIERNQKPGRNPKVTIAKTDVGFATSPCGGWKRIAP